MAFYVAFYFLAEHAVKLHQALGLSEQKDTIVGDIVSAIGHSSFFYSALHVDSNDNNMI